MVSIPKSTSLLNPATWIHSTGTNQGGISLDNPFLEVDFQTMINAFIIPTTAWMWMTVTHHLLVDAESSGWAVEEVLIFTGHTVWSRGGTAPLTTMRVTDLLIILFTDKPIIQIVTVSPCVPLIVTGAPKGFISFEELLVVLSTGGVDGEDLV